MVERKNELLLLLAGHQGLVGAAQLLQKKLQGNFIAIGKGRAIQFLAEQDSETGFIDQRLVDAHGEIGVIEVADAETVILGEKFVAFPDMMIGGVQQTPGVLDRTPEEHRGRGNEQVASQHLEKIPGKLVHRPGVAHVGKAFLKGVSL